MVSDPSAVPLAAVDVLTRTCPQVMSGTLVGQQSLASSCAGYSLLVSLD